MIKLNSSAALRLCTAALLVSAAACADRGGNFVAGDRASMDKASDLAVDHLTNVNPTLLAGVDSVDTRRVSIDELGGAHVRLTQQHDGVTVFEGEGIAHLNPAGDFVSLTDDFLRGVRINPEPLLTELDAIVIASEANGGFARQSDAPAVELNVLRHDGADHLVWKVQLSLLLPGYMPSKPLVFVDAHDATIVRSFDNLAHTALDDAPDYRTYDAKNRTRYNTAVIADSSDTVANDAHTHAGLTLAYYAAEHGRDSFDAAGARVDSYVHFDSNYVNAFWNGSVLTYGDGDGVYSDPLVSLDVVAHEFSHGMTEYEANLTYANESGALNEATSDIMAAAVEAAQLGVEPETAGAARDAWIRKVYWVGEDIWIMDYSGGVREPALRYMDHPSLAGDWDYYPTRYTGTEDNGGVHGNSGIANLFFFLLAEGGEHPAGVGPSVGNPVAGIGIQNATDVWYVAVRDYLTAGSTFSDAWTATVDAAAQLGHPEWTANIDATWLAVGVPAPPSWTVVHTESLPDVQEKQWLQIGTYTGSNEDLLRFAVNGDTGDADLYVRAGAWPTSSAFDCQSAGATSNEQCDIENPGTATYFVSIYAWASGRTHPGAVTGATYTISAAGGEPQCTVDADCGDGIACTLDTCSAGVCTNDASTCECSSDGDCTVSSRACEVETCQADLTCSAVDASGCCDVAADCDDVDSCTDDTCDVDGFCQHVDNGTCGGQGGSNDPCDSNDDCASNKCRSKGPKAGTCA